MAFIITREQEPPPEVDNLGSGGSPQAPGYDQVVAPPTTQPATSASPSPNNITGAGYVNSAALERGVTPSKPSADEAVGKYNAATYSAKTITPWKGSTVENRITNLLKTNNPYIAQARRDAVQMANRRGLANSSMAAGVAQAEANRTALPIAQQDAQTFYDSQTRNQAAINEARQTNTAAKNRFRENEQAFDMNKSLKAQENRYEQDKARLDTQLAMLKDENAAQLQASIAEFEENAKVTAQQKQMFAQEASKILQSTQDAIKEIGLSDKSPEQQAHAIQQVINQRNAQIQILKDLMAASSSWTW